MKFIKLKEYYVNPEQIVAIIDNGVIWDIILPNPEENIVVRKNSPAGLSVEKILGINQ